MATDVIIALERLRCIRESDAEGHSEPYLWPTLLWIDDTTLTTPALVGVTAPALGNARVVIKNDMSAGQTADIPPAVGVLRLRFENGLTLRRLIFAVALWEEDETPEAAVRAGFLAFSSELRAALADNLLALFEADRERDEDAKKAIIAAIKARVKDRVKSAIQNSLTAWQKARVFAGILNLDDIIDSAFGDFGEHPFPEPIALTFTSGTTDRYEIAGNLQIRPVAVDRCQSQVNAVREAQTAVDDVDREIQQLQAELKHASPTDKPFINSEIKRVREEELPAAMAALDAARVALSICRSRLPPTLPDKAAPGAVLA